MLDFIPLNSCLSPSVKAVTACLVMLYMEKAPHTVSVWPAVLQQYTVHYSTGPPFGLKKNPIRIKQ